MPGNGKDLASRLAERTADLQRLSAEYANYRKRVERDRLAVREQALANVLSALIPALDDIGRAREHGELTGGFKAVAESLDAIIGKLGLVSFGVEGEPFDPRVHEALMHSYSADVTEPTCVKILQPGYKVGERILRPARVAVAEPAEPTPAVGAAATAGASGAGGAAGTGGPARDSGSSRAGGPAGPSGPAGASGPAGPSGPAGASGPPGPSGPAGTDDPAAAGGMRGGSSGPAGPADPGRDTPPAGSGVSSAGAASGVGSGADQHSRGSAADANDNGPAAPEGSTHGPSGQMGAHSDRD